MFGLIKSDVMNSEIIRTENLTKYFGKVLAVRDMTISVRKGEIYGFVGLNGAGKTTTIRMLLGMIRPNSGICYLFGKKVSPGNTGIWNRVGYMVEIPYSYPDLTVRQNLEIFRRMRLIRNQRTVDSIMDHLQLGKYADRLAKNLSLGNAQRLGIAKALLHKPEILILDEPANGLDPAGIVEIRELLTDLAGNHGVTIFISSHILGELSKYVSRIGIIHEGRLIQEMGVEEMEKYRNRRLQVNMQDVDGAGKLLVQKGYHPLSTENGFLELKDEEAITQPEMISSLLVHNGFPPSLLKVEEEDLESYFLRVIKIKKQEE